MATPTLLLACCCCLIATCLARPDPSAFPHHPHPEPIGIDSARSLEDKLKTIHSKDSHECIPRLLCEMAVSAKSGKLTPEEASILSVFADSTAPPDHTGKAPINWYKFATDVGSLGTDPDRCQLHFDKCPLAGNQLLSVFKAIVVKP